jgi:hypothetical protein
LDAMMITTSPVSRILVVVCGPGEVRCGLTRER